ncbi:MAG: PAS domain S-box protein [bacterium]|nr:PAS domain S-box protein [bacterium]
MWEENDILNKFHISVINSIPIGAIAVNSELVIADMNPAMERISGLSQRYFLGLPLANLFFTLFEQACAQGLIDKLQGILTTKTPLSTEAGFSPERGERICRITATPLAGEEEAIMGILLMVEDITERKRANENLKRYQFMVESAHDVIFFKDLESRYIIANAKTLEAFGLSGEEVIGKNDYEIMPDKEEAMQNVRDDQLVFKTGEPAEIIKHMTGADGKEYWFQVIKVPHLNVDGSMAGLVGIARNITTLKQTGEELKKHRDHLEELVEERTRDLEAERERLAVTLRAIGDGVIATDVEGKIVLINKAAENLTGWTQRDVSGKPLREVFHIINEKTGKRCDDPVKKVLESGGIVRLANGTALIAGDGTKRLIDDSGAPIYDKDNRIIGVVLVFRDVTEKRAMQEELLKVQKLESLGILAGGIAHDFNNILTTILGNINLAQAYYPQQADKVLKKLETAERASLRAKDLTQQLLTFARGGAPIKKIISIAKLLQETTTFALSGANVRSEFSLPDALWPIECDPGQISQVIDNLIINAREAMPEGGIVEVKAENIMIEAGCALPLPEGKYIKVAIKDQGPGISKEHFQKIFDPFFTTKEEGRGLGLTTVHSIIKRHGGYIELESEPDAGTTFYIYLPASGEKLIEEKEVDRIFRGEGKILLMDDETDVRETTGGLLKYIGYEVEFTGDGAEAIELYKKAKESGRPFEAVILDLTIPGGMGGKEAVAKLIEIDPEVRAIVSSGYSNDPIMADFREYGFSGVVSKPYKIEELSQALRAGKG